MQSGVPHVFFHTVCHTASLSELAVGPAGMTEVFFFGWHIHHSEMVGLIPSDASRRLEVALVQVKFAIQGAKLRF